MIEIISEDLITGLRLAVVGVAIVFLSLFGVEIMIRILGKIWGPKGEVLQAPPLKKAEKKGG
jgi:Na+-transporting methylmalonyl-CoA/oxaloacetate decarboxylase gamma subunit